LDEFDRSRHNGIYQGLVRATHANVPGSAAPAAACRRYCVCRFSFNAHPEIRKEGQRIIVLDDGINWDGKSKHHPGFQLTVSFWRSDAYLTDRSSRISIMYKGGDGRTTLQESLQEMSVEGWRRHGSLGTKGTISSRLFVVFVQ
jgi:hypothetical protein